MRKNTFWAILASCALLTLSACTSNTEPEDGEFIDGSMGSGYDQMAGGIYEDTLGYGGLNGDVVTSVDTDGTLIVGDPNAMPDALYDPSFAGPQALRDNNTVSHLFEFHLNI